MLQENDIFLAGFVIMLIVILVAMVSDAFNFYTEDKIDNENKKIQAIVTSELIADDHPCYGPVPKNYDQETFSKYCRMELKDKVNNDDILE